MTTTQKWIDTHVHIFPSSAPAEGLPKAKYGVNTPANYRKGNKPARPSGVVVVHFSKAADSRHVVKALDEMTRSGCKMPKTGVIKADVTLPETFQWILREDVGAVRVYAKESAPDFSDKAAWNRLWNLVRSQKKHVLVFGGAPYLRDAIANIPADLPLVIDHLGLPDATKGGNDPYFNALLSDMVTRNKNSAPVYYKGPGYRTSLDPKKVQPFVNAIIKKLGADRLLLGASDGPFAGPVTETDVRYAGKNLTQIVDFDWIHNYTNLLAAGAKETGATADQLLYTNAAHFYGWEK